MRGSKLHSTTLASPSTAHCQTDEHRLHLRFTFGIGTLTIKIPSAWHEEAHANFSMMVIEEAIGMGIARQEYCLFNSKTQTQHCPSALYSAKEGNSPGRTESLVREQTHGLSSL